MKRVHEPFAYVIAFIGDDFIMVRHRDRAWEMPGGRVQRGEDHEEAAKREFFEETGMHLKIVREMELGPGKVFAGLAGRREAPKLSEEVAEVRLFSKLPESLSFPEVEYRQTLDWARRSVESFKSREAIVGLLRH